MAEITNVTYLMRKAYGDTEFSKLVDITSYPDLGGTPESIDITTLSDTKLRNMNGLQAGDSLEFGALYSKTDYETLNDIMIADRAINDVSELATYRVFFGVGGMNGIWEWQGKLSVFAGGGEPNARREMTITISDEGETELSYVTPTVVHVTGVTLDESAITLDVGDTETLVATVAPSDATDTRVTWSSSDSSVASVDSTGLVTGLAGGTATITVTTNDGSYTDTCAVTVNTPGITLSDNAISVSAGSSETLTATTVPAGATVDWQSDDTAVATVSGGVVTGESAGTANVTAKITVGGVDYTDTCVVTVS